MKHLRGRCEHCGGRFHFPAEGIGTEVTCPHCGQDIELALEQPAADAAVPRRNAGWFLAAIVILLLGLAAALYALKRAESLMNGQAPGGRAIMANPR